MKIYIKMWVVKRQVFAGKSSSAPISFRRQGKRAYPYNSIIALFGTFIMKGSLFGYFSLALSKTSFAESPLITSL